MVIKTQYALTEEAVSLINAYATERKRGEFISRVIVEYARLLSDDETPAECGVLEQINRRLEKIERRTARLFAAIEREE